MGYLYIFLFGFVLFFGIIKTSVFQGVSNYISGNGFAHKIPFKN